MTKEKITEFLGTAEGKMNAVRFIKALKEHRILCTVKRVSPSGTSRDIAFREVRIDEEGRVCILQFDWFLERIGYKRILKWGRSSIRVGGAGMDMIFHTLDNVCYTLKYNGFELPEDFSALAEDYLLI